MKRFVIFRHAKSSWDKRGRADHDRPLADRGRRDGPRMGERLARRGIKPDLLLVSSAKRARETAELIEPALKHASLAQVIDPDIYLASSGKLIEILKTVSDDVDELLLIGHNPGLTQLANQLLPEFRLHNLPTAGAVAIESEAERWRYLDTTGLHLRFYDYPKNPDPV
ncbi:MAG TPA: histidine phosphatase family protein [Gammaproteobacteria bacterium]|nr:histidine phosphatase family protein [Gammaproteobacteria bacterium]